MLVCGQVPYRLHSVLVHEGQAGSGHYWAYVLHPQRKVWLKVRPSGSERPVTAAVRYIVRGIQQMSRGSCAHARQL